MINYRGFSVYLSLLFTFLIIYTSNLLLYIGYYTNLYNYDKLKYYYFCICDYIFFNLFYFLPHIKINILNNYNIDLSKPKIYVTNHISTFDPFIYTYFTISSNISNLKITEYVKPLTEYRVFSIPLFGSYLKNIDAIPVYNNPKKDIAEYDKNKTKITLNMAKQKLENSKSLLIAFEGRRNPTPTKLNKIQKGKRR